MTFKTGVLHNMAIFMNGDHKIGVATVTLPTAKLKTITKHYPGTQGDVEIPVGGQEVRTLQVDSADLYPEVLESFGACAHPKRVTIRSIEKDIMSCEKDVHVIHIEGIWTELNNGSMKVGDENSRSYSLSCRKYRHEKNGQTIDDYDALAPNKEDAALLGL